MQRDVSLTQLREGYDFDLLVIGGGINGAGIARDARLRGLTVALVDQGDWGSGTSSRSSRLIHGGLRYLEHGRIGLVREALHERATLLRIAPHLVRPLRFLAPAWGDTHPGLTSLSMGVKLYGLLAGKRRLDGHETLGPGQAYDREPGLRRDRLQGAVSFVDARCDDARLVLATVRSAFEAGAACASYLRVEGLVTGDGRVHGARLLDLFSGQRLEVRARVVVNATGPWAEETAALAGERRKLVRLTRGAHLVVPRLSREALLLPTRDRRVLFVLPAGDCSILGTTDTDHRGPLDDVAATGDDVDFILGEARAALPRSGLARGSVLAAYAALRPLVAAPGAPGALSRESKVEVGPTGLVSVVGGKLTTYRALADEVVRGAARLLGRKVERTTTAERPLVGADGAGFARLVADAAAELQGKHRLPREHAERLASTHGTRVAGILELLAGEPRLVGRLCPRHPHLAVEAAHAAREEMAMRLSDFLFRRTRVAFGPCRGEDCAEAAAEAMAAVAGWSRARREDEVAGFREEAERLARPRAG